MVRAIQVLRLMQQRRPYRMTSAQLAKELGVSQRQAFRWLAACYLTVVYRHFRLGPALVT